MYGQLLPGDDAHCVCVGMRRWGKGLSQSKPGAFQYLPCRHSTAVESCFTAGCWTGSKLEICTTENKRESLTNNNNKYKYTPKNKHLMELSRCMYVNIFYRFRSGVNHNINDHDNRHFSVSLDKQLILPLVTSPLVSFRNAVDGNKKLFAIYDTR